MGGSDEVEEGRERERKGKGEKIENGVRKNEKRNVVSFFFFFFFCEPDLRTRLQGIKPPNAQIVFPFFFLSDISPFFH